MRNQRISDDDHHTDEQCSCCGGWFDHHDIIEVAAEPPDVAHTGPRQNLELCENCINYEISDGFADTIRDTNAIPVVLPRVEFDALTEECKLHRILAFIPATEQINTLQDVEEFFDALSAFMVWHPDTAFEDYRYQQGKGPLIFAKEDAKSLDQCLVRCVEVCARVTKQTADVYDLAIKSAQKAGRMPTDAEYEATRSLPPQPTPPTEEDERLLGDWKYSVANGDTRLGFADWLKHNTHQL